MLVCNGFGHFLLRDDRIDFGLLVEAHFGWHRTDFVLWLPHDRRQMPGGGALDEEEQAQEAASDRNHTPHDRHPTTEGTAAGGGSVGGGGGGGHDATSGEGWDRDGLSVEGERVREAEEVK